MPQFAQETQAVLKYAAQYAETKKHDMIYPEHLLLGLLQEQVFA